jgi:hypothetical protein
LGDLKKAVCAASLAFAAAAAFAAVSLSAWLAFSSGSFDLILLMAPVFFFPIALMVILPLGVPTFLLLRPLKPGHWSMPIVAGAILGLLPMHLWQMPVLVPLSALSALVFWLTWLRTEERERARDEC